MNDLPTFGNERAVPTFVSPDDPRLQKIRDRNKWYEPRDDAERARVVNDQAQARRLVEKLTAARRVVMRGRYVHMHKNRRLRQHKQRPPRPLWNLGDLYVHELQTGLLYWSDRQPVRIMGESEVRLTHALLHPATVTSLLKDSNHEQ